MTSGFARAVVRYGYSPFMFLGLNGAAFYVVTNSHSHLWIATGIAVLLLIAIRHGLRRGAHSPLVR